MILLIDNYDSFTFNVKHYLLELGVEVKVFRNDKISINKIVNLKPKAIVLSPGPCTPNQAGISLSLVSNLKDKYPILGICLGHQTICQAFGSKIIKCNEIMHGKIDNIYHFGHSIFKNVEKKFEATRYHSLIIERKSLSKDLIITAETADGTIMGVMHKKYNVHGVQFHPESIKTKVGLKIIKNFIKYK